MGTRGILSTPIFLTAMPDQGARGALAAGILLTALLSPAPSAAGEAQAAGASPPAIPADLLDGAGPGTVLTPAVAQTLRPPPAILGPGDKAEPGWVSLALDVGPDGRVIDARVTGSSDAWKAEGGHRALTASAVDAARSFTYTPATRDGVPVAQHGIPFLLVALGLPEEGSRKVVEDRLTAVDEALARQDAAGARAILDALAQRDLTLYEAAHHAARTGRLHLAEGRPELALWHFRRAVVHGDHILDRTSHRAMLRDVLRLELSLGHTAAALHTYETLVGMGGAGAEDPALREAVDRFRKDAADPGNQLVVDGRLALDCAAIGHCPDGARYWEHRMHRRTVEVQSMDGRIDQVVASCTTRVAVLPVVPGSVWRFPADWGDCTLRVVGGEGARVSLLET